MQVIHSAECVASGWRPWRFSLDSQSRSEGKNMNRKASMLPVKPADFLRWLGTARIPVPPLGPSRIWKFWQLSCRVCLFLSFPQPHTPTLPPPSSPFSFLSPAPFLLRLPDEVSELDSWLLAAQFASTFLLSITYTQSDKTLSTNTPMYTPQNTSHEYLMSTGALSSFRVPHFKQI